MNSFLESFERRMSKSFIKKVLIDEGELDRLQQRQLRDYSPELQSMARLQTQMAEVLARKDLSPQDKLSMLSGQQSRFDKIKKDIGVLSGGPAPTPAIATPKPDHPKEKAEDDEEEEKDEELEEEGGEAKLDFTFTPTTKLVRQIGVQPQYEQKARNLMSKIRDNPEILRASRTGEIEVNGEPVPGSNFDDLFKSMVGRKQNLNLPGIAQFLGALRQMGVRSNELSGNEVKEIYKGTKPHGGIQSRLAALRGNEQVGTEEALGEDKFFNLDEGAYATPKEHRPQPSTSAIPRRKPAIPAAAASSSKNQQSGKGYPPGKRPKILYVY